MLNQFYVATTSPDRWTLTVNTSKTKVVIFRKGGRLPANIQFNYKGI